MENKETKLPHAKVSHHYYSSLGGMDHIGMDHIQFLRLSNAYKNDKDDDYTTKRIRIASIVTYEAYDHTEFMESYNSKLMKSDLGETAYAISINFAQGAFERYERFYFCTCQQRDDTLEQLDIAMGVCESTIEAKVTVINPAYQGSAKIQELPKI